MADATSLPIEPEILEGHVDIAAEALSGIAIQCAAAARFLLRGDTQAAVAAYERVVKLHREFAAPSVRIIADTIAGGAHASS